MELLRIFVAGLLIILPYTSFSNYTNIIVEEEWNVPQLNTGNRIGYLSELEQEMILEINMVRSNPKRYKQYIFKELVRLKEDSIYYSNLISMSIRKRTTFINEKEITEIDTIQNTLYNNKIRAIYDLIDDLNEIESLPILIPHKGMYATAVKHGIDQKPSGDIEHRGTDGSWPWERVVRNSPEIVESNENIAMGGCTAREIIIQLLIDSGVPGYGHRYNILNPDWEFVSCHQVLGIGSNCGYWIQEFGRTEKAKAISY